VCVKRPLCSGQTGYQLGHGREQVRLQGTAQSDTLKIGASRPVSMAPERLAALHAGQGLDGVRNEQLRRDDLAVLAHLPTAAQLFAVNDYETTSLDMIADQLGMHRWPRSTPT
jgi:hypothetical protein